MKKQRIIISVTELSCGAFDAQHIHSFEKPGEAKSFIKDYLFKEAAAMGESTPNELSSTSFLERLWYDKEGSATVDLGTNRYVIGWLKEPADGRVTDDETVEVLESFVNSSRTRADYDKVAALVTERMHRYCINELWKFVKSLVKAFSVMRYDERNQTAHDEAASVQYYMEGL